MAKKVVQAVQVGITELIISKSDFKKELNQRIEIGQSLIDRDVQTVPDYQKLKEDFSNWYDYNIEFLKQSFNRPINEYRRSFEIAGETTSAFKIISYGGSERQLTFPQQIQKFKSEIAVKLDNLKKLYAKSDLLKSNQYDSVEPASSNNPTFDMTEVFIVHGHDDLAKTEVARFIEKMGFKPIILHEQASSGKTIIEKIEEYSNVGFGIVLYTPCDIGSKKGEEAKLNNRARQNVVFEHGYLIGKIGRNNVCAIVKDEVEIPNDISGVVYVSMDNHWQVTLAKELRNSGYAVDMNLVI